MEPYDGKAADHRRARPARSALGPADRLGAPARRRLLRRAAGSNGDQPLGPLPAPARALRGRRGGARPLAPLPPDRAGPRARPVAVRAQPLGGGGRGYPRIVSAPELSVVCRSCGSEVSPYVTECPYCGTRLRKRAPKLERQGDELTPRESRRQRRRRARAERRERRAERGILVADRPYAVIAAVLAPALLVLVQRA